MIVRLEHFSVVVCRTGEGNIRDFEQFVGVLSGPERLLVAVDRRLGKLWICNGALHVQLQFALEVV